ncbi:hypothetical protein JXB01_02315 [Candidatus Micrarchaeota archaeon]|nr:hypothetical protein [Candidatus Micrarchaeota archaeon]
MNFRKIVLVLIVIAIIGVVGIAVMNLQNEETAVKAEPESISAGKPVPFLIKKADTAGDYFYIAYQGYKEGEFKVLLLENQPYTKVQLFKGLGGIGAEYLDFFSEDLRTVEKYGIELEEIIDASQVSDNTLVVVPLGAMPNSLIEKIQNTTGSEYIYLGKTDLMIKEGVQEKNWYEELNESTKKKIVVLEGTLDEYYQDGRENEIMDMVLFNEWMLVSENQVPYSDSLRTEIIPLENAGYARILAPTANGTKAVDMQLNKTEETTEFEDIFTWETVSKYFDLSKTEGVPVLKIEKNGEVIGEEKIPKLGTENVFYKQFKFSKPGIYVIKIEDYNGTKNSGIIKVKNFSVVFAGSTDYKFRFNVSIDEEPVKELRMLVFLNNSTNQQNFSVSNGELVVPAKLQEGKNTFNFIAYGQAFEVFIYNEKTDPFAVYANYGPWIILVLVLLYFGARMLRRPVYKLRVDDAARTAPIKEIKISAKKLAEVFEKASKSYGINGVINTQEYAAALKKWVTDGYDLEEGSVENLLGTLKKKGAVESYHSYYQLKGSGDITKNVMNRKVREALIENGIQYETKGSVFSTKDYDVILPGGKIGKKRAVMVFENSTRINQFMDSLSQKEKSILMIRVKNGKLSLADIHNIEDYL